MTSPHRADLETLVASMRDLEQHGLLNARNLSLLKPITHSQFGIASLLISCHSSRIELSDSVLSDICRHPRLNELGKVVKLLVNERFRGLEKAHLDVLLTHETTMETIARAWLDLSKKGLYQKNWKKSLNILNLNFWLMC